MENKIKEFFNRVFYKTEKVCKENSKIVMGFLLLVLVLIIFNISKPITKKDFFSKIQVCLESGKINSINKYIKVNNEKVSNKELVPLIDYYLANSEEVDNFIYNLKRSGKSGNFTVESEKTLLGEQYYLNVNKIKVRLTPTIQEAMLYLNDEKVDKSKYVEIVPGRYKLKYTLNTEYGDVSEEKEVELFTDKEVEIAVAAEYITLYSNFEDAEVFINGNSINKKVSEVKGYGPIPNNKNITIHIEKKFPWGNIKSSEVNINNKDIIKIDIEMANEKLLLSINDTLDKFYDSLFEALNEKDASLITCVDESSREVIFNSLYEKTALFSNSYTISDMQLRIGNSEFKYENNEYRANILVDMNYSVAKKILPFIKEENEGSFLVGLVYRNDMWVVESCQKIKLNLEVE